MVDDFMIGYSFFISVSEFMYDTVVYVSLSFLLDMQMDIVSLSKVVMWIMTLLCSLPILELSILFQVSHLYFFFLSKRSFWYFY